MWLWGRERRKATEEKGKLTVRRRRNEWLEREREGEKVKTAWEIYENELINSK